MNNNDQQLQFAGFWVRVLASLVDSLIMAALTIPILWMVYGRGYFAASNGAIFAGFWDFLLTAVLPSIAVVYLWVTRMATPGKEMLGARVVDAETGQALTLGQAVVRYLGYFASIIPFGLGLVWVGIDPKKRGWHDLIAGSVVIYPAAEIQPRFSRAPPRSL
jgi:uncharacterized RDD family membrane protein YckC